MNDAEIISTNLSSNHLIQNKAEKEDLRLGEISSVRI